VYSQLSKICSEISF